MELLDGSTLEELAAASGGKLPAREVLDAIGQVLDVLAHAHARASSTATSSRTTSSSRPAAW